MPKLLMFLLCLLLLAPGLQAQDNPAYVFLYNSFEGALLRINTQDASQARFELGLGQDTYLGGSQIALFDDGNTVAYCANSPQESTLVVRDLPTATNRIAVPLGTGLGCEVNQASLSPAEDILVVSQVFQSPDDPSAAGRLWAIMGFNTANGSMMFELSSESPLAAQAGMLIESALLPQIRAFDGNEVIFAEIPFGVGGAPDYRAFRWQPAAGILNLDDTGRWGKSGLSVLPGTDEIVWLDYDSTLPALEPNSPLPSLNVVMLADPEQHMIHHTGDWILADTAYINGGTELALLYLTAMDMDNPTGPELRWVALDRQGNLRELATGADFSQLSHAPGGYTLFEVFLTEDALESDFRLSINGQTVWEVTGMGWEMTGVTPEISAAPNLPPFADQPSG